MNNGCIHPIHAGVAMMLILWGIGGVFFLAQWGEGLSKSAQIEKFEQRWENQEKFNGLFADALTALDITVTSGSLSVREWMDKVSE